MCGLSPQVRGTRWVVHQQAGPARFIPAGAGNTEQGAGGCNARRGLSPQVRGTHKHRDRHKILRRFIPAGAGNTQLLVAGHRPGRGLSPQVRGTRVRRGEVALIDRFIPAGAGNTLWRFLCSAFSSVYPRRCGEHTAQCAGVFGCSGLSPQVRGTLTRVQLLMAELRFIPAGAGNTVAGHLPRTSSTVYPRRCGEHSHVLSLNDELYGLSPQVRGTPLTLIIVFLFWRFIPAGAGNTGQPVISAWNWAVYPRRCGEHILRFTNGLRLSGLSPQVRGTHWWPSPSIQG